MDEMLSGLLGDDDEDTSLRLPSSPVRLPGSSRRKHSSTVPVEGVADSRPPLKRVCPATPPGKILLRFSPRDDATRAAMDAAGLKPRYEMVVPVSPWRFLAVCLPSLPLGLPLFSCPFQRAWSVVKVMGKLRAKWAGMGDVRLQAREATVVATNASAWTAATAVSELAQKYGLHDGAVLLFYSWASPSQTAVGPAPRSLPSAAPSTPPTGALRPAAAAGEAVSDHVDFSENTCMGIFAALDGPADDASREKPPPSLVQALRTGGPETSPLHPPPSSGLPSQPPAAAAPRRVKKRIVPTLLRGPGYAGSVKASAFQGPF